MASKSKSDDTEEDMADVRSSCQQVWKDATDMCYNILGEDDYELITSFKSPEQAIDSVKDLEVRYAKSPVMRMLTSLQPHLNRLQTFVTFLFLGLGAQNISSACIWGAATLLIELASQSERSMQEVTTLLNDLGQQLALFEIYSKCVTLEPDLLKAFFDVLVDIMLSVVSAIKFFRKNDVQTAVVTRGWSPVHDKFLVALRNITSRVNHLRELVKAQGIIQLNETQSRIAQSLASLHSETEAGQRKAPEVTAKLPCYCLPFRRNSGFFGRREILAGILEGLAPGPKPSVRTVALWGTGGIGKTQLALEYANLGVFDGVEAILWVGCETEAEIAKAFNSIAAKLELDSYSVRNTPAENRYYVLQWLQATSANWLMVLDNVESESSFVDACPLTGNGSILITCRSEYSAAAIASTSIEVPAFTPEESGELLLRILGRADAADERLAAVELAERLGGLALAVDIMAQHIRISKRFRTIRSFIPYYDGHRQALLKRPARGMSGLYYPKDLSMVWQAAFENLSPNASKLLSLICFLAPEGIPLSLLETKELPAPGWEVLTSEELFDEARAELLDLALIRMNEDTGVISIHRLTQDAYFDRIDNETRVGVFGVALILLRAAYPNRGFSHFYTRWSVCEVLRQHVLFFQGRYEILMKANFSCQDEDFTRVLCDSAWYLMEIQSFQSGLRTLLRARDNCEDKESWLYGYVCHCLTPMYELMGRAPAAVEYAGRSLAIWEKTSEDPKELAMAHSHLCYALGSARDGEEALAHARRAIAYADKLPEPERYTEFNLDRFLRNSARARMELGQYDMALEDFGGAERIHKILYGPFNHYDGECALERAKIAARQGDLAKAHSLNEASYRLVSMGKPTHSSVMATRYRQAVVLARQGDDNGALGHLHHALQICQLNEAQRGDKGESARVKWRLAQILERKGLGDEARLFREDAEKTRRQLDATGDYIGGVEGDEAWDVYLSILCR